MDEGSTTCQTLRLEHKELKINLNLPHTHDKVDRSFCSLEDGEAKAVRKLTPSSSVPF